MRLQPNWKQLLISLQKVILNSFVFYQDHLLQISCNLHIFASEFNLLSFWSQQPIEISSSTYQSTNKTIRELRYKLNWKNIPFKIAYIFLSVFFWLFCICALELLCLLLVIHYFFSSNSHFFFAWKNNESNENPAYSYNPTKEIWRNLSDSHLFFVWVDIDITFLEEKLPSAFIL